MLRRALLVLTLSVPLAALGQEPKSTPAVDAAYPQAEALYLDLHQNPELSLQEEKTAAKLAERLRKLGYEVTTGVGGHGVVGVLRNGQGPTVMLRTDMDGLPVEENTGLAYASKARARDASGNEVGVMHACGHDLHMAAWTGAAAVMAAKKNRWRGTLVLIAQPAEEITAGARAMLKDGLFTRFPKPDYALAVHVSAELPAGTMSYTPGYALANSDSVDVTIYGKGGHGAYPHKTIDPIVIAARTVLAWQTIVAREVDPRDPAVITVGSIRGGTKHNIIPDEVRLQLTVRSYKDEVREQLLKAIERVARAEAAAAGATKPPVVKVRPDGAKATYNDPQLTERIAGALRRSLGEKNVTEQPPVMGAEDFSEYGRAGVPAVMFWVGTVDPAKVEAARASGEGLPSLHSAEFAPQYQPALRTAVAADVAALMELMRADARR